MVGTGDVPKQTPRRRMGRPPSRRMLPPEMAEEEVMLVAGNVLTVGIALVVVKVRWVL